MRNMAKPKPVRREQVFFAAVAVDEENYYTDSKRVLAVLKQAGYVARPMTHEMLRLSAEDPAGASPQWREIGPSPEGEAA